MVILISVEERTGTIDGRNYAGIIYGALTDDGYGIGTPFKSSKIGKDVGYKGVFQQAIPIALVLIALFLGQDPTSCSLAGRHQ